MGNTSHDFKRLFIGFFVLLAGILGIIAGFASAKYGVTISQPLYVVSGIADFLLVGYAIYHLYKNYLKY